jgi:hypothetical protein
MESIFGSADLSCRSGEMDVIAGNRQIYIQFENTFVLQEFDEEKIFFLKLTGTLA